MPRDARGQDMVTQTHKTPLNNNAPFRSNGWSWWYLLFIIQCVAVLWPPFYNKAEPAWLGMPFFYWYQLLWVIIGAVLTAIVYFAVQAEERQSARER